MFTKDFLREAITKTLKEYILSTDDDITELFSKETNEIDSQACHDFCAYQLTIGKTQDEAVEATNKFLNSIHKLK